MEKHFVVRWEIDAFEESAEAAALFAERMLGSSTRWVYEVSEVGTDEWQTIDSEELLSDGDDVTWCDDCAEVVVPGTGVFIGELPVAVASANVGESASLCRPCADTLGLPN